MTPGEPHGLRPGHLVALAGALVTLLALWRPWYAVTFPPELRDAITSQGAAVSGSALGQFAQALATALPDRIEIDGWQAFEATDVVLCVACIAVVALVAGAAGALGTAVRIDRSAAARLIAGAGVAGAIVVARRLVDVPGPDGSAERFGLSVTVQQGAWLALAGCVAMALGGALAAGGSRPSTPVSPWAPPAEPVPAEPVPAEDRTLTSVAPPGA